MAKNVTIAGASYTGVPFINLPKTDGSGDAKFVDEDTISYDTPSISVSSAGLITASANGKSGTKQLTTQVGKTVTPTKAQQTAVAAGRYTIGDILVGAIPAEYIVPSGSQTLTENKTYDVTELAQVVVSVEGDVPVYDTPTISVSTGGLITASANGKTNTQQLATQPIKTVTPTESQQTAVPSGRFTTGNVLVGAIPSDYIGSAVQVNYYHVYDSEPSPSSIPDGDFVFIRG